LVTQTFAKAMARARLNGHVAEHADQIRLSDAGTRTLAKSEAKTRPTPVRTHALG
jgi:hypothetical protein